MAFQCSFRSAPEHSGASALHRGGKFRRAAFGVVLALATATVGAEVLFVDGYERPLPPLTPLCPQVGASQAAARIQRLDPNGNPYTEISGIALSRRQQVDGAPVLWLHNDSGGGRRFAAYSLSGQRLTSFRLDAPGIDATDWEDLALGPCGVRPGDCLYLANIGNNAARTDAPIGTLGRTELAIYRFDEPQLAGAVDNQAIVSGVDVLRYRYGSGSPSLTADAEALFVDSTGDLAGGEAGDLYLVTKWNTAQASLRRVFAFPRALQGSGVAVLSALDLPLGAIPGAGHTRADQSAHGGLLALGDYFGTRLYTRGRNQTVAQALAAGPCRSLPLPAGASEFQFEALGLSPAANELVEISECVSSGDCDAPIHRTVLSD
jgi:hypothetical protein